MHPTNVAAVIRRYKRGVADVHEALMDVSDRVCARTKPQVINLVTEICKRFEPGKLMALVSNDPR